ncbi:pilus assembly protein N-terminal domain-containing protein [Methylobacterium nodulans]|uniref:pilus assembly protein N-terminal domain-containing protein n=1 Tax=Methylobacterium nodulans TaxID=114616 RepID=UPI003CC731A2
MVLQPKRPVQAVVIGDPKVADATHTNVNTLVITGKELGTTSIILFDSNGRTILNARVQVVSGADVHPTNAIERREIRVRVPSKEPGNSHEIHRYLCGPGCSPISDPIASSGAKQDFER